MYHIAFIIKNILLHYSGIALIKSKGVGDYLVIKSGFRKIFVFFCIIIMFVEDLLDPSIHWKSINVMQTEKAHAVGYFFANAVKAGKIFHGSFMIQFV